MKCGRP